MSFFRKWFKKPKPSVECPRCLGKGHVDKEDITRLGQELRWAPGRCAYCNGTGGVEPDSIAKVPVDEPYLTTDLSKREKRRIFDRDEDALEWMRAYNANFEAWINQIRELHFVQELTAEQIVEALLRTYPYILPGKRISVKRQEILEYVRKVIYQKD
jgi:hypothetical protein